VGLSVHLLGPPRIERGGTELEAPRGNKAWGLLAYLVRARVAPSRERLAVLLFPEAEDPLGTLRWTLSTLRRRLGDAGHRIAQDFTADVMCRKYLVLYAAAVAARRGRVEAPDR